MALGFERLSGVGEPLWTLVLNTNSPTPHVCELGCSKLPTTAGSPLVHTGSLGPTMLREGRVVRRWMALHDVAMRGEWAGGCHISRDSPPVTFTT